MVAHNEESTLVWSAQYGDATIVLQHCNKVENVPALFPAKTGEKQQTQGWYSKNIIQRVC